MGALLIVQRPPHRPLDALLGLVLGDDLAGDAVEVGLGVSGRRRVAVPERAAAEGREGADRDRHTPPATGSALAGGGAGNS